MSEQLKEMMTQYKNNGDRVDEVLFQTVMKELEGGAEGAKRTNEQWKSHANGVISFSEVFKKRLTLEVEDTGRLTSDEVNKAINKTLKSYARHLKKKSGIDIDFEFLEESK